VINTELIFSDLEQIETKLPMIEKKAKSNDKESAEIAPVLKRIKELLEA
jgi:ribosome-binding ATPase YchF (GTP1/OBG family)